NIVYLKQDKYKNRYTAYNNESMVLLKSKQNETIESKRWIRKGGDISYSLYMNILQDVMIYGINKKGFNPRNMCKYDELPEIFKNNINKESWRVVKSRMIRNKVYVFKQRDEDINRRFWWLYKKIWNKQD
ncbi:hypothetical protein, partial [Mycoplasma sp. CSL10166]|uniref:hypothetical protein n=1 Tax=Mycoplasma sp. CSL10166 TaxID=2813825 RepID=UPI00197C7A42